MHQYMIGWKEAALFPRRLPWDGTRDEQMTRGREIAGKTTSWLVLNYIALILGAGDIVNGISDVTVKLKWWTFEHELTQTQAAYQSGSTAGVVTSAFMQGSQVRAVERQSRYWNIRPGHLAASERRVGMTKTRSAKPRKVAWDARLNVRFIKGNTIENGTKEIRQYA